MLLVALQTTDFLALLGNFRRYLVQHFLALLALGKQAITLLFLLGFYGREFVATFADVLGQRSLALKQGGGLSEQLLSGKPDDAQIVHVASCLARILAVEQQLQCVRMPLQVVACHQIGQLRVQLVEIAGECLFLLAKFLERRLQTGLLARELVQFSLRRRNIALDIFDLIGRVGTLPFRSVHLLAQGFNLAPQFLEVRLFFRDLGAGCRCVGLVCRVRWRDDQQKGAHDRRKT